MTEELREFLNTQSQEIDDAVREAIELCDGSPMRALYAAIIANKFLSEENDKLREENARLQAGTSNGFVRGAMTRSK